jgi:hypothetical protein
LVICPSVCPFDHGSVIAARTAALSFATPGKRSDEARVGVAYPGIKIVVGLLADHGLKALDEAPGFSEHWRSSLDGCNDDRIRFGEMIASHGHHPHDCPRGRNLAQPSLPGSYASISEDVVGSFPHYGAHGCAALGMTTEDRRQHIENKIPPSFNPLPYTYPAANKGRISTQTKTDKIQEYQ